MRVPLSWLREFIDVELPSIKIAKILTMAGLEVEAIEKLERGFSGVVVGKVTAVEKHPDADRLHVATVTDGKEEFQVVCGAPNCRAGMRSAFAPVGALLPEEGEKSFKIKKTKIRGVESFGMLCSGNELCISDDAEGIVELDEELPLGSDLADLFSDTVFEVALTPNLAHCANIQGVARELHAATEAPIYFPELSLKEEGEAIDGLVKVTVRDTQGCPRYGCRLVRDVTIAPSPRWLQNRLIGCGVRPINNVVDVTNYVLMECGHPLHGFDFDKIAGGEIIVRRAMEREKFVTLDGKEQTLHEDDVLICDSEKPVAIGGIMGGENSEVTGATRNVLLEAAYFTPTRIRKTGKRLGLMTESSRRFERGADPNIIEYALDRAAMLLQELAGGKVVRGVVDAKEREFPDKEILCRVSRVNRLLGTQFGVSEIEHVFRRLNFPFEWDGEDAFTVSVPTYRGDIDGEADLIEEVARLYGYENLHGTVSPFNSSKLPHAEVFLFEREVRSRLLSEGLQEFLTCDLIGPALLGVVQGAEMSEEAMVRVMNPTSIEQSILRTSLLPGLLQTVKYNADRQNFAVSGFEVGRVHFKEGEKYREETVAGILLSGRKRPHFWGGRPEEADFYDLKGIIENLLAELGIAGAVYRNNRLGTFHDGRQASVYVDSLELGSFGEVHPAILRRLDLEQRVLFAEFNLHDLYKLRKPMRQMASIPIYPGSSRDWTVTLEEELEIAEIFRIIDSVPSSLLESRTLLDVYRSDKLGRGLKNATFRFLYRDRTKTVSQEVVDKEHTRITDKVRSLMTQQQE